jgi:hypothetical protein
MALANTGARRASCGWQLGFPVEDRFDVVPVRVDDERCVIPGVVMRAKTRWNLSTVARSAAAKAT